MANKKGPPPEKEMLAPMWVVTFGDLISLLVTFFVLIFTFSSVDADKLRRVSGAMDGGVGVMTDPLKKSKENAVATSVPPTARTDLNGAETPARRAELEEELNTQVQDPAVFDKKVNFEEMADGFRIRLEGDNFFRPGAKRMSQRGRNILRELASFFKMEQVRIVVEAHTDSETSGQLSGQDAEAWTREVSSLAAGFLVEQTGWNPARIGCSGRGDSVPIAPNDTAIGRRANRRIELQIIKDPKVRQIK